MTPAQLVLEGLGELLERTLDAARVGVLSLDVDRDEVRLSAGLARLLGAGEHPFTIGVDAFDSRFCPTGGKLLESLADGTRHTGKGTDREWPLVRVDGATIWVRCDAYSEDTASGRRIVAIMQEVTRLHELISLAPDGIFLADLDGRYTDVNDAGCKMLGYTREEIIGKTIVDLIPEADVPRLAESKDAMLEGRADVAEWQLRRKDGTYVPVEVSAKILPDGRWQGFVRDITDRKRSEAELAAKNTALEEADRMKDEMISVVAHDLRTPITSILGYLELALEDGIMKEEQRKFLDIVSRSSRRLERLAEDLLFISRLRAGRLALEPEPTELMDVLQSVVDALAPSASAKGIDLVLQGTGCEVVADAHRVFQAVENLVSNAVKFSPEGSRVTLELAHDADGAAISVRDEGPGISAEDLERVFDRFFRAAGAETVAGAGLGLSIVKAVADAHGGTVRVQSVPGEGATFVLRLPREPVTNK